MTALQTVCPAIGEPQSRLWQPDSEIPETPSLIALINAINEFSNQLILVLDDYHVISSEAIHNGVDYLIRRLPANLHLIIVSRHEPPLALSRLRAQNAVVEINLDDLKFTIAETRTFLSQIEGVDLDSYQLGRLTSKTERWITSPVLAIPTIRRLGTRNDLDTFIEHFGGDHHYVLDFFN